MHIVIKAIVYANNESEALEKASTVFQQLVYDRKFDDYTTFDHDSALLGPVAARADSQEGKQFIEEAFSAYKIEWLRSLQIVKHAIAAYTDEELFEDRAVETNGARSIFKYHCGILGQYRGEQVFLYDQDGEGITDSYHLQNVLSKLESTSSPEAYRGLDVWVVPANVHY